MRFAAADGGVGAVGRAGRFQYMLALPAVDGVVGPDSALIPAADADGDVGPVRRVDLAVPLGVE